MIRSPAVRLTINPHVSGYQPYEMPLAVLLPVGYRVVCRCRSVDSVIVFEAGRLAGCNVAAGTKALVDSFLAVCFDGVFRDPLFLPFASGDWDTANQF